MPKASRKPKQSPKNKEVLLERRDILGGRVTMLVPQPITNSGKADGGWMDRVGISAVGGLGHMFLNPSTPVECFYSNDAYAKAGFCTMHLELHPLLECIVGETTTPQGLAEYLESYVKDQETDYYSKGNYRKLTDVEHIVQDPSTINSMATTIVQVGYEIPIKPGPNIPKGLTATTYAALLYFQGKGNVIFRANNFERHSPPLSYPTLLSSIEYKPEAPMFRAPALSDGFPGMSALSGGDLRKAKIAMARARCRAPERDGKPEHCLNCGADEQPNGQELLSCGRCKTATYCQRSCATSDWKRHKKTECTPKKS